MSLLSQLVDPSYWINRLTYVVTLFVMVLFALWLIAMVWWNDPPSGHLMTIIVWCSLFGIVLLEERRQPSGSVMTTGILPTRQTVPMIIRGALWSTAMLFGIATIVFAAGGSFTVGTFRFDFLTALGVIIAAIGEELFFRTTILRVLNDRFGPVVGIVSTSALFALAHTGNSGASFLSNANTFLIGIALGVVVTQGGSMWLAAGFHVVWNLTVALFFGTVSGNELGIGWLTVELPQQSSWSTLIVGDTYGIESGLATTLMITISLAVLRHIVVVDPFVIAARIRSSLQMKVLPTMRP